MFLKWDTSASYDSIDTYCYWFDDDVSSTVRLPLAQGISSINASALSDGLHVLRSRVEGRHTSPVVTRMFLKWVKGITRYEYLINNDEATLQRVTLPQASSVLQVAEDLEIPTYGFRPGYFYFDVEDNSPRAYAMNDLTLRFYNVQGRTADTTLVYVDTRVGGRISVTTTLQLGTPAEADAPATNGINWYTLHATESDSLVVASDQPCTLQVFGPDGQELGTASEATALSVMPTANGNYYIAAHSLTDTTASSITITALYADYPYLTETITVFSSPSFTATLNANSGTAQYINNYYRLGGGGSLTLTGKSNVNNIVSVKMNLQDPARSGSDMTASLGTVFGDSIADVNATSLTITANGSWPQLWLSSLTVTYEGTAPTGTYAIRLPQYMTHGTVTCDKDWADEGDVVTLTATADADCHLTHLYANRGAVTLTPSTTAAYQYTFTMPAEDVTIGALFAEGGITTGVLLNVPEDDGTATTGKIPVYNLQGQRLRQLHPGINIVGGKKVVSK